MYHKCAGGSGNQNFVMNVTVLVAVCAPNGGQNTTVSKTFNITCVDGVCSSDFTKASSSKVSYGDQHAEILSFTINSIEFN